MFLFKSKKIQRDLPNSAYRGIIEGAEIYDAFFLENMFWEMIIVTFLLSPLYIFLLGADQWIGGVIGLVLVVGLFGMFFGVLRLCGLVYQYELLKYYPGSSVGLGGNSYSARERRIAIIKSISVPLFLACFPVAVYVFFQSFH